MAAETGKIKQSAFISAAPGEVYKAFVDPVLHARFTGAKATGQPKKGGRFTAWDGAISGIHKELEKDKRILQEWIVGEWGDHPPSLLEFRFAKKGSGTKVTMIQSRIPAEHVGHLTTGWVTHYWDPLKKYFAGSKTKTAAKGSAKAKKPAKKKKTKK